MTPPRFGITLVVLYAFTNLQLLLALESGTAVSSAPPPRSSCSPLIIGGFILSAIIGGGVHHLLCPAGHHPPATDIPAYHTAISTTESFTFDRETYFFMMFPAILLVLCCMVKDQCCPSEDTSTLKATKNKCTDKQMIKGTIATSQVKSMSSVDTEAV